MMLRWLVTKNSVKPKNIEDMFEQGGRTYAQCRQALENRVGPVLQYSLDGKEWQEVPTVVREYHEW